VASGVRATGAAAKRRCRRSDGRRRGHGRRQLRARLKVESTVNSASRVLDVREEQGSLDAYLWSFVDDRPIVNHFRTLAEFRPRRSCRR